MQNTQLGKKYVDSILAEIINSHIGYQNFQEVCEALINLLKQPEAPTDNFIKLQEYLTSNAVDASDHGEEIDIAKTAYAIVVMAIHEMAVSYGGELGHPNNKGTYYSAINQGKVTLDHRALRYPDTMTMLANAFVYLELKEIVIPQMKSYPSFMGNKSWAGLLSILNNDHLQSITFSDFSLISIAASAHRWKDLFAVFARPNLVSLKLDQCQLLTVEQWQSLSEAISKSNIQMISNVILPISTKPSFQKIWFFCCSILNLPTLRKAGLKLNLQDQLTNESLQQLSSVCSDLKNLSKNTGTLFQIDLIGAEDQPSHTALQQYIVLFNIDLSLESNLETNTPFWKAPIAKKIKQVISQELAKIELNQLLSEEGCRGVDIVYQQVMKLCQENPSNADLETTNRLPPL